MRTNYSIKNTITSFISNIISYIFLFVGQTIFIKILGIEYTGLNGLFGNVLTLLSLFELGIGSAIIYSLYKYIASEDKEQIKSLMDFYRKAYNIIALVILIVGLAITPFIKYIVHDVTADINIYIIYILFLLSTVATYVISYKRNLIYAYQRNYILNIIHIVYLVVLNVLQLLIIFITKNYYLYLIIKIVCILLENIIINIKANKDYPYLLDKKVKSLDKRTRKDITSKVKALFVHKTAAAVSYGTDNILISAFLGIKSVGLYTSYYYIINVIDTLFRSVIASTGASVGDLLVEKDYKKNFITFKKIRFLNFIITVVTAICLLNLIEPFITLWLGKEYLLSKIVLIVLIINYFQSMMRATFMVFKDSAGIWVEDRYIPVIQIIINLSTSILFLILFGMVGVFMGTICSYIILWVYSYPKFVYKKLLNKDYKNYYLEMFKEIIIFSLITLITYYIISLISINGLILELIIKLLISLIVPIVLLYLIYRRTDEYKYYIYLLKDNIRKLKIRKK